MVCLRANESPDDTSFRVKIFDSTRDQPEGESRQELWSQGPGAAMCSPCATIAIFAGGPDSQFAMGICN